MKITLDGKTYEFESDWLVNLSQEPLRKKLDPASGDAFPPDVRLAAKGMLRFHLNKILQIFADELGEPDWKALKPGKNDDLLLVIHDLATRALCAAMQNTAIELRSVPNESTVEGSAPPQLALTGAALGPLQLDAGRLLEQPALRGLGEPDGEPTPAALPEASGA